MTTYGSSDKAGDFSKINGVWYSDWTGDPATPSELRRIAFELEARGHVL